MSDSQNKGVKGADLIGLVLFTGGTLISVLVIQALWRDMPTTDAKKAAALARFIILSVGHAPALLCGVGMLVLGLRAFLNGELQNLARDGSGVAATAAGLAFLLGAFSESAGGGLGSFTGGNLASFLTVIPAAILGLAAFAAPIWLTWVKDSGLIPTRKAENVHLSVTSSDGEVPTSSTGAGVSAEEADALLPDPDLTREQHLITQAIRDNESPDWAKKDESAHPYPADARLKGEIPPGATAIEDPNAAQKRTSPVQDDESAAPGRWTPSRDADVEHAADDDLALGIDGESNALGSAADDSQAALQEADEELSPSSPPAGGSWPGHGEQVREFEVEAPRPRWETPAPDAHASSGEVATLEEDSSSSRWVPGRSSVPVDALPEEVDIGEEDELEEAVELDEDSDEEWESAEVAEEDSGEEVLEEEDAEELTPALASAETDEVEDSEEEEDEEWEYIEVAEGDDGEEELQEEEEELTTTEAAKLEEVSGEEEELEEGEEWEYEEVAAGEDAEEGEEGSEEDSEEEWEYVEVAEGEEGWEEAEEIEEEEEEVEAEPELVAAAGSDQDPEPDTEEEQPEEFDREFAELLAVEEQETATAELEPEPEPEIEETVGEAAPEEPGPEPLEASVPEPVAEIEPVAELEEVALSGDKLPDEVQMDLFADPEPAAEPEPVVVLSPQASPGQKASPQALEAATLILSEERVAVSMLQRSIGLDFKQSCLVLDELQELGFIGPYVDGNSRDILMDREEWLTTVGAE